MAREILFDKTLKVSEATDSASFYEWKNISGVKIPNPDDTLTEDKFNFILNGIKFDINYFLDGDTKYKWAYRVDKFDTIMIELIKETGLANIKLRKDKDLPLEAEDNKLVLYYVGNEAPMTCIINLVGSKCMIVYENGDFKIQEVE